MPTCGIAGWGGPAPGDPSNNSILTATPAFGGIRVSWNMPTTNPFAVAYTKLYRGVNNNFVNALLIQEVGGGYFFDPLEAEHTYYYWIQFVSVHGTVGETIGPASATSRGTIQEVIQALTGEIDSGMLATALRSELDQISILNNNLLNEIFDRETGQTSLAAAIANAQAGIAEAHTFIINETNSRVAADAATVEHINGVAATLEDDFGVVVETLSVDIDAVNDRINAMYTVRLNVNGLIGGFGIANDGVTVQAGFDVDSFWVGRTGPDQVKPFIISGGDVYIDSAVIQTLTADKINGYNLKVMAGNFTGFAYPTSGGGFYLGPEGFLAGRPSSGQYLQIGTNGDLYMPGLSISGGNAIFSGNLSAAGGTFTGAISAATGTFSGTLTAAAINAVNTINIAGQAVSTMATASGTDAAVGVNFTVPKGENYIVTMLCFQDGTNPDDGNSTRPSPAAFNAMYLGTNGASGSKAVQVPAGVIKIVDGDTPQILWGYSAASVAYQFTASPSVLSSAPNPVIYAAFVSGIAGLSKTVVVLVSKR